MMSSNTDHKQKEEIPSLSLFGIPQILPFTRPYRKTMCAMLLFGCLSSAIGATYALFNRYALDHFIAENTANGIGLFALAYLGLLFFQLLLDYFTLFQACRIEIAIGKDLRAAAFNHLQTLSFSYFNQNSVGYTHFRVMSDTGKIGVLMSWRFMDVVWNISTLVCMILIMLVVNFRLGLILFLLLPITALLVWLFQQKLTSMHRKIRELNSKITGNFNEGITGAKSIKTLVVEELVEKDFREDSHLMRTAGVHTMRYQAFLLSAVVLMGSVSLALILWRGGALSMQHAMQIGTLSVFMSYALNIMEPVQIIVETFAALIQIQVNIERLTRLLSTRSDVVDAPHVIEKYGDTFHPKKENWEPLYGDIEFRDVSFTYPDGKEEVLSHFCLTVPQGQNVAIVGETGAGKSTLVNLVCRFYEPTSGEILVDGVDLRERSQLWLHSNIGYVLQTPHLFSGTVRDNLKYGRPEASDAEIWQALHTVSADQIIKNLDHGLDSEVGEGGGSLSTGEKQLLSFARALLADPRILVLDEATSSIDTVMEKAIQDAISTVIKGRTSFVIAHRLSTIVEADLILVVKDGKIVERGTHKELLQRKGYYEELYSRQFEALLEEEQL